MNSSSMTRIARGAGAHEVQAARSAPPRRRSATRAPGAATITSRAFVAQPLLDDRLHRDALQAEDLGDLGQHAGLVGDLEVQVEGRLDVVDDRQRLASARAARPAGSSR